MYYSQDSDLKAISQLERIIDLSLLYRPSIKALSYPNQLLLSSITAFFDKPDMNMYSFLKCINLHFIENNMKRSVKIEQRTQAIKELIQTYQITDHHKLVELLKLKYGIDANQTMVSRELHKLGITKTPVDNRLVYELPEEKVDPAKEILRLAITQVTRNETLIVVHTLAGLADFVGDYLDAHTKTIEILATLAGENVVFVSPKSIKNIDAVYNDICKLLHIKQ